MLHLFVWYRKTYPKVNIIGLNPLNKFPYHFINLGSNLIYIFLHRFTVSSWCFSSHTHSFRFSTSFLFWMSHWGFWSFLSNIIPWYEFYYARIRIDSIKVNQNINHCCVITVFINCLGITGNKWHLRLNLWNAGYFCFHVYYGSQEKSVLRTWSGIFNVENYRHSLSGTITSSV